MWAYELDTNADINVDKANSKIFQFKFESFPSM